MADVEEQASAGEIVPGCLGRIIAPGPLEGRVVRIQAVLLSRECDFAVFDAPVRADPEAVAAGGLAMEYRRLRARFGVLTGEAEIERVPGAIEPGMIMRRDRRIGGAPRAKTGGKRARSPEGQR